MLLRKYFQLFCSISNSITTHHSGFPTCNSNLEIGTLLATLQRPWSPFKKQFPDRPQPQYHKCLQCAPARPTKVALVQQRMKPPVTVESASNARYLCDVATFDVWHFAKKRSEYICIDPRSFWIILMDLDGVSLMAQGTYVVVLWVLCLFFWHDKILHGIISNKHHLHNNACNAWYHYAPVTVYMALTC